MIGAYHLGKDSNVSGKERFSSGILFSFGLLIRCFSVAVVIGLQMGDWTISKMHGWESSLGLCKWPGSVSHKDVGSGFHLIKP